MVQPIQAPIAKTATNAINTGIATSQSLMVSRAGQNSAIVYDPAIATQTMQINAPIA